MFESKNYSNEVKNNVISVSQLEKDIIFRTPTKITKILQNIKIKQDNGKEIPFIEIDNSETIGISSGASAPEKLVQTLLDNIKKDRKVSIEEVIVADEKVVFKLPKELN